MDAATTTEPDLTHPEHDDEVPRRVGRRVARIAGAVLVAAGAAVPFLLVGPFGDDDPNPRAASGTATRADAAPSSGAAPGAASSATSSGATAGPSRPAVGTPVVTTPAAKAPVAPTATARTPPAPAPKPAPATTGVAAVAPEDRSGQVFVDPAEYVGSQATIVRAELLGEGLLTTTTYEFSETELTGTVLRLSPSGWVADDSTVDLVVAL